MSSPNKWDIPGGRADKEDSGELETAQREGLEELGSFPDQKKLLGRYQLPKNEQHSSPYTIFIWMIDQTNKNRWKIIIDDESQDWKWFDLNHLPNNTHFDLSWIPEALS